MKEVTDQLCNLVNKFHYSRLGAIQDPPQDSRGDIRLFIRALRFIVSDYMQQETISIRKTNDWEKKEAKDGQKIYTKMRPWSYSLKFLIPQILSISTLSIAKLLKQLNKLYL